MALPIQPQTQTRRSIFIHIRNLSASESESSFDSSQTKEMLEKTIQNLELPIIQEYQETHPDEDAKIIRISSGIDQSQCERMNIMRQALSIERTSLIAKVDDDLKRHGFKEILQEYWAKDPKSRSAEITLLTWRKMPNGGNQGTFDFTMLHVRFAYRNLGLDPIWPRMVKHEVGLSEPIRIAYKPVGSEKTLTSLLYGLIEVEYVYLTQIEHREPRTNLGEPVRKALSDDFDELLQNSVYRPLLENELFLVFTEYQLPIEDAVGFSILKSMAMMKIAGATSITWSLGNGVEWIFGIIIDSDKKYVYHTKIFRIDTLQDYEELYSLLVYCGAVSPKKLLEVFQSSLTAA